MISPRLTVTLGTQIDTIALDRSTNVRTRLKLTRDGRDKPYQAS